MNKNVIVNAFEREKRDGKCLVEFSACALAGYYLVSRSSMAATALTYDLMEGRVSQVVAATAKILLDAVVRKEGCKEDVLYR